MGSIIVSPALERQLREEHFYAKKLLALEPQSEPEKEMLEQTANDQNTKRLMALGVGFSFGLSLKRYFPEAFFVNHAGIYAMTMIAIMLPCFCLANVYTNREVIQQLQHLDQLHQRAEIMKKQFGSSTQNR